MPLLVKEKEPAILAAMIDRESAHLLEAGASEVVVPRFRTRSGKIDIGRSMFYMIAIDELHRDTMDRPLTHEAIAREKAVIQREWDEMTEQEREEAKLERNKIAYHRGPLPEGASLLALDDQRFNVAAGLALLNKSNLGQLMLNAATHYFAVRASAVEKADLVQQEPDQQI